MAVSSDRLIFLRYQGCRVVKTGHFAGDIGGICGVFIGFSLISIVELLYFLVLALLDLFCGKSTLREDDDREKETKSIPRQTVQTIYWNELLPRSWQSMNLSNSDQFFNNTAR